MRSHECASKYPTPDVSHAYINSAGDDDLRYVIFMLLDMAPSGTHSGIFSPFPGGVESLWMSNLFVDLAQVDRNLPPAYTHPRYITGISHHQGANANIFLAWYIFLGGHVEEETFWAVNKSCVIISSFSLSIHQSLSHAS